MIVVHVREIESKAYAGIFWAANHDQLWWLVDQVGDPADYEWCRAKHGGIVLDDEVSTEEFRSKNLSDETADDDEGPFRNFGVRFDEYSADDLREGKWKPFDFATQGHGGIAQLARRVNA